MCVQAKSRRVALCLSLDGSVCPRQGVGAPSRGSKKGGPPYYRPGAAVKKGLQGMKGGMEVMGNKNGRRVLFPNSHFTASFL